MGMRMCGIEGIVVHEKDEVIYALNKAADDREVGVVLITERLAKLCAELVSELKLSRRTPLIVEIPDRHGSGRSRDSITKFVREAIGVKV